MGRSLPILLCCTSLLACQTVESQSQPIAVSAEPLTGRPVQAWEAITERGERLGLLVRFEASQQEEVHFMVRNVWHQDLGLIDANGRAYRFLPHSADPFWVGTGTVLDGVERVLDSGPCHLFEIPFRETQPARTPGEKERRRVTAGSADLSS